MAAAGSSQTPTPARAQRALACQTRGRSAGSLSVASSRRTGGVDSQGSRPDIQGRCVAPVTIETETRCALGPCLPMSPCPADAVDSTGAGRVVAGAGCVTVAAHDRRIPRQPITWRSVAPGGARSRRSSRPRPLPAPHERSLSYDRAASETSSVAPSIDSEPVEAGSEIAVCQRSMGPARLSDDSPVISSFTSGPSRWRRRR
jgi:hypothetical protein